MTILLRRCPYCGKTLEITCDDDEADIFTNVDIPPVPCEACHAKFVKQNKVPVWGVYKEQKCLSSKYFFTSRDELPTEALQRMSEDSGFLVLHQEPFEKHLRQLVKDGNEAEIHGNVLLN